MIYIIGHTKPDLDSVVGALSLKYLFDNAPCFNRPDAQVVLASEPNYETRTIFKKFSTPLPMVLTKNKIKSNDQFVLVDHNETTQRLEGISNDQILDIFDHHKFSASFSTPIFITTKPWGATNTLIWWLMEIVNVKPNKNLAGLMISAIMSDTIGFKSPTTTPKDQETIKQLNKIAQISNIDELILTVLKAKSNLSGLTINQIITKDYKLYELANKKFLFSQIETADQNSLLTKVDLFKQEIVKLKKEMQLFWLGFFITDIFKINTKTILIPEDETILKKAFPKNKQIGKGIFDIGPVMSRKKELVPPVEKLFS